MDVQNQSLTQFNVLKATNQITRQHQTLIVHQYLQARMPSASIMATAGAGAIFGAALTASGVYSPSIILSQMRLEDFHMLQVFLTATGSSALAMVLARRLSISECKPRSNSTLGWFHSHDGNIIGGALLGVGMALTGACPGTVLVQVATGIQSGYYALGGGLLGGFLYLHLGPYLKRTKLIVQDSKCEPCEVPKAKQEMPPRTLISCCSIKEYNVVLVFELVCLAVVLASAYVKPSISNSLLPPIAGGLLIGGAQASSLALTGNAVGVSTAYEQIGKLFSSIFSRSSKKTTIPLTSVYFATGIVAGSYLLSSLVPIPVPGGDLPISVGRAILGGVSMVFGARMAGGCTSGHGISGMSTLSVSSIVTVASIFAGGIGFTALLG